MTNDEVVRNIRRYGRAMKQCGRAAQQARFTTEPALKLHKQLQAKRQGNVARRVFSELVHAIKDGPYL
jgi:hypothetical protein